MHAPRPMCFVAMPFGRKTAPGAEGPEIDFDRIYDVMAAAIEAAQLDPIRADVEAGGGFVHKAMYERLLVAEYVVADLTFANPNVTYEVGVRHGTSGRPTVLVGALGLMGELPFDFAPLRVMPYALDDDGRLSGEAAARLSDGLRQRLRDAAEGRGGVDNPVMQLTSWTGDRLEHDKTDVFLERIAYADEVGEQIRAALTRSDAARGREELQAVERQLLGAPEVVAQLHSALMAVYLGYRRYKAWQDMVELYGRLPRELQATAVAREQLALATNRLAEEASKAAAASRAVGDGEGADGQAARAVELRRAAIAAAELPEAQVTAETWGIRGRIYKGWYEAERGAGRAVQAEAALAKAIEAYESGVEADMRDYYPGVNAVTLRLRRGSPADLAALERLIPVVRMAAEVAPPARSEDERYWRAATELELASAAKDFDAAKEHLLAMLALDVDGWMRETTADNLRVHADVFGDDPGAVALLDELIDALRS